MRTTSSRLYADANIKGVNCVFFSPCTRPMSAPSARRRRTASVSPSRHAYIRSLLALSCLSASTRSVSEFRSPPSTRCRSWSTLHSSSSRVRAVSRQEGLIPALRLPAAAGLQHGSKGVSHGQAHARNGCPNAWTEA